VDGIATYLEVGYVKRYCRRTVNEPEVILEENVRFVRRTKHWSEPNILKGGMIESYQIPLDWTSYKAEIMGVPVCEPQIVRKTMYMRKKMTKKDSKIKPRLKRIHNGMIQRSRHNRGPIPVSEFANVVDCPVFQPQKTTMHEPLIAKCGHQAVVISEIKVAEPMFVVKSFYKIKRSRSAELCRRIGHWTRCADKQEKFTWWEVHYSKYLNIAKLLLYRFGVKGIEVANTAIEYWLLHKRFRPHVYKRNFGTDGERDYVPRKYARKMN
jgi:hypothetical protein